MKLHVHRHCHGTCFATTKGVTEGRCAWLQDGESLLAQVISQRAWTTHGVSPLHEEGSTRWPLVQSEYLVAVSPF